VFGPYPASPQEREGRVRQVFGDAGPLRVVQMRGVRHRCPGCRSAIGDQCTQGRRGGRRKPRSLCHPSRVAVSHPCPEHQVRAGVECPGEHGLAGVCEAREKAAKADLDVLAAGVMAAAARRAEQDQLAAQTERTYRRSNLTGLDRRG
jgi:hypothetical protein